MGLKQWNKDSQLEKARSEVVLKKCIKSALLGLKSGILPNVVWMKAVLYYVYILRGVEKLKPNWIDGFYTFEVTQLSMESNNIVVRMKESKYIKQCCIVRLNLKFKCCWMCNSGKESIPIHGTEKLNTFNNVSKMGNINI